MFGWLPHAEYPVTRQFSFVFSVITWVLFTLITAALAVVSFAAYGYETISVLSPEFNATQEFWFDHFIPRSLMPQAGSSCQPFAYRIGDSFRTSSRIFTWEIINIAQNQDEQGNWESGSLFTSMPYSNVQMDYCDVSDITLLADLFQQSVQLETRIMCTLPIPMMARTIVSASELLSRSTFVEYPWTTNTTGGSAPIPPQMNVSSAMDMLGTDLWEHLEVLNVATNGSAPSLLEAQFTYHDSSDELTVEDANFYNPVRNVIRAMHSAARADLGSYRANNLFQNEDVLHQQINATAISTWYGVTIVTTLQGANAVLGNDPEWNFSALPLTAPGPSVMETTYLCNRQVQKSAAALFFSITSGTWSNLFAAYGFWMFISTWYLKRKQNDRVHRHAPSFRQSSTSLSHTIVPSHGGHEPAKSPDHNAEEDAGHVYPHTNPTTLPFLGGTYGYTHFQRVGQSGYADPYQSPGDIPLSPLTPRQPAYSDCPPLPRWEAGDPVMPIASAFLLKELLENSASLVLQHGADHGTKSFPPLCPINNSRAYFTKGILPEDGHASTSARPADGL
ncbi:hypothetical protein CALCODRAFT_554639 [Calocera cornea HHB12733]|uniref:Uncharacterized protein n=1 Tax=Calocera cornea HHB12733 TaxID=1353952 RepID=A0A165GZC3_9BASI|nr:hypothetical protein CALCODRAFT_554639 [Calocera cornea HHB12733]